MKKSFSTFRKLAVVLLIASLPACASKKQSKDTAAEKTLGRLSSLGGYKMSYSKTVSPMRAAMVRDAALSVGARTGLAHRGRQINRTTMKYDKGLSRVYNFTGLMLGDNVIPPILVESDKNLYLANNTTIRVSDRIYEIIEQARFVTVAPNWRDYLIMKHRAPEDPDESILPKSPSERAIWRKYIAKGWEAGIKQAESIFAENLARLQRDYIGMVRYHSLLSQNMVTPPYVGSIDMGVTGDSKQVNVNDRILRITALPQLKTDSKEWRTVVIQNDR